MKKLCSILLIFALLFLFGCAVPSNLQTPTPEKEKNEIPPAVMGDPPFTLYFTKMEDISKLSKIINSGNEEEYDAYIKISYSQASYQFLGKEHVKKIVELLKETELPYPNCKFEIDWWEYYTDRNELIIVYGIGGAKYRFNYQFGYDQELPKPIEAPVVYTAKIGKYEFDMREYTDEESSWAAGWFLTENARVLFVDYEKQGVEFLLKKP